MAKNRLGTSRPRATAPEPQQQPAGPVFGATPVSTAPRNEPRQPHPYYQRTYPPPSPWSNAAPRDNMGRDQARKVVAWLRGALWEFAWGEPVILDWQSSRQLVGIDSREASQIDVGAWMVRRPVPGNSSDEAINLGEIVDAIDGTDQRPVRGLAGIYTELFQAGTMPTDLAMARMLDRADDVAIVDWLRRVFA